MSPAIRNAADKAAEAAKLTELSSVEGQAKFAHGLMRAGEPSAAPRAAEDITAAAPQEITLTLTQFDEPHYRKLIAARSATIRQVVGKLKPVLGLATAVDAGCAVGFFAQTLSEAGLTVCGFDGRSENVAEARRRFPEIPFETGNVEEAGILELGKFDVVLSFGLLYHLENPLRAMRNLRELTGKCLFLESMCAPGEKSELLLREEPRVEDQSLTDMACYPSESSLVKMLYRTGFTAVYRVAPLPDHEDFRETAEHARRRTVLLASMAQIDVAGFRLMPEPREERDPWDKKNASRASLSGRLWRFAKSPARAKYITMAMRARRRFTGMAIPLRLRYGAWWLAEESALDEKLIHGEFEGAELKFVERYLERGMTAVDIGAHHGLYTVLAAKCVGREGKVLAFEPSERECARLRKHLRMNRCRNVQVMQYALGSVEAEEDLYMAGGKHDFCNSLRLPDVPDAVQKTRVKVRRLDEALEELATPRVDFVKLDAEGGEVDVLAGSERLLERRPRPVLLVEVEERRTRPWNYRGKEIIERLERKGFRWHWVDKDGRLEALNVEVREFAGNFVAIPAEREGDMRVFCKKTKAE
jgi:FkbM family methyltransferase